MARPAKKAPKKRILKDSQTVYSDLYKLEPAQMIKNVSWSDIPEYEKVEHCHFFHSFDSDGKPQSNCTMIGGHYHKMEIINENPDEPPIVRCVSGPLKVVKKKIHGRYQKVEVQSELGDEHTHEIQYLRSEPVIVRKMIPEIINMITSEHQKITPPSGLIG